MRDGDGIPPIDADAFRAETERLLADGPNDRREHARVFVDILAELSPIDFRAEADLPEDKPIPQKTKIVLTVQLVLAKARELRCGLCRNLDFVYAYNGEHWQLIDKNELEHFLGEAAKRLGVDPVTADYHRFKTELVKQFLTAGYLPTPEPSIDAVLINLKNGTFDIGKSGSQLRGFNRLDFLTYQLPFSYNAAATCPKWSAFLDEVLPDRARQNVLAEFIGYVFARHLKLEKTLILYGTGANGKSVFFDVVSALFARESISNISLESICKSEYHRAVLANKLLNFSPEISTRMHSAEKFKQLTSGEPIEARLPYGQPMILRNYARLAFNTNELPRDVEHSEAFFRRFLIVPFDVTIPEPRRNPNLAREIIETELSGVFNWVLAGLDRVLRMRRGPRYC